MTVFRISILIVLAFVTFECASSDFSCTEGAACDDVTSLLQIQTKEWDDNQQVRSSAMGRKIQTIIKSNGLAPEGLRQGIDELAQKLTPDVKQRVENQNAQIDKWMSDSKKSNVICKKSPWKCPERLVQYDESIGQENVWHYHMLHDDDRNEFFWKALEPVVKDKKVVVVGSGSGILDIMAAKLGANHVDGIEQSPGLAQAAAKNVHSNGFDDTVKIYNKMSTNFAYPPDDEKADVLVAEILGDGLNGELGWEYMSDARIRLLKPGGTIIPACGANYVTMLQSNTLWESRTVKSWHGINLEAMNRFSNTMYTFRSDKLGFPLQGPGSPPSTEMSARTQVSYVDYYAKVFDAKVLKEMVNKTVKIKATKTGPVHALVTSWSIFSDLQRTLALHSDDYSLHRRGAWQLMLQVVAEEENPDDPHGLPKEFHVKEGEDLLLDWFQIGEAMLNPGFRLRRQGSPGIGAKLQVFSSAGTPVAGTPVVATPVVGTPVVGTPVTI